MVSWKCTDGLHLRQCIPSTLGCPKCMRNVSFSSCWEIFLGDGSEYWMRCKMFCRVLTSLCERTEKLFCIVIFTFCSRKWLFSSGILPPSGILFLAVLKQQEWSKGFVLVLGRFHFFLFRRLNYQTSGISTSDPSEFKIISAKKSGNETTAVFMLDLVKLEYMSIT